MDFILPRPTQTADTGANVNKDVTKPRKTENKGEDSPQSDPFCSIPALMGISFCSGETSTVGTTSAKADDQSHSTISDGGNKECKDPVALKSSASSMFQTWGQFMEDFNNNICGKPAVDGPPPTIDFAMPIDHGSSTTTDDKSQSSKMAEQPSQSLLEVASYGEEEPKIVAEPETEENEATMNETIVIYYTDSGLSSDKEPDTDEVEKKPFALPPKQTVVTVDQAGTCKSPGASLSNLEADSTEAIASCPFRFQNLATGSFCEISTSVPIVDKAQDSPVPIKEEATANLHLIAEVKEDTNKGEEFKEEQNTLGTSVSNVSEKVEQDEELEKDEENYKEDQANEQENEKETNEAVLDGVDALETTMASDPTPAEAAPSSNAQGCTHTDNGTAEQASLVSEPMTTPEPSLALESSGNTIKIVSLFVGVFDFPDTTEHH